jgi:hypothetical protein
MENATFEEFSANPEAFGFPSFERYQKERERFVGHEEEILASADKGSTALEHTVHRHVYEIEGYRCKNLEEVEKIAKSQGIDLRALDYRPQLVQAGAGKFDIIVKFVSKTDRDKRKAWA